MSQPKLDPSEAHKRGTLKNARVTNSAKDLGKVLDEQEAFLNDDSFIEYAPVWLDREDPPQQELMPGIPLGVLGCIGGRPRAMKSLVLREIAISGATATPAFGIASMTPLKKFKVLICAQEDKPSEERKRIKALLRGRGITEWPDTLALAIHKQISLDNPQWIERLKRAILKHGFLLVIIDPARRFTKKADKGPSDVIEVTNALREIIVATGCTILICQHFTKDPVSGQDARKQADKISGGDWFASSECPIIVEKLGKSQKSLVAPTDYKYSEDPAPFTFEFKCTKDDVGDIQTIQLIGHIETENDAASLDLESKILAHLTEKPNSSGAAVQRGVKAKKESVFYALDKMRDAGKVSFVDKGNAKLWSVTVAKSLDEVLDFPGVIREVSI